MSLSVTSLNSGSNGNCYYIGNENEAILIDAGLSCRETEKRMRLLDLSMKKIKAIFISHEHADHIKGLPSLSAKYDLPVYITDTTLKCSRLDIKTDLVNTFKAYVPIKMGNITVTAFPKHHDAEDPHSFVVDSNNITIGVFTDIGIACSHVTTQFKKCHAAFLETNYDEALLENGRYPYYLKNRIRGNRGHLSNSQALDIFRNYRPTFMTHLFLSHLSKDNNDPELVKELFNRYAATTKIIIASRYEQTPVYIIESQKGKISGKIRFPAKKLQLSLFEAVITD